MRSENELLGQAVLHADGVPVAMLGPSASKRMRDLWSYCKTGYALNSRQA